MFACRDMAWDYPGVAVQENAFPDSDSDDCILKLKGTTHNVLIIR